LKKERTVNDNGLGNLDDLFQSARDDGLTADTLDLVISNLDGPTMLTAVGVPLNQLGSNEVTLAMNILDVSGSMVAHAADVIRAYNEDYLAAMAASGMTDDILVSTVLFNDRVKLLHGYVPLADAPPLTAKTYDPDGTTALYDAVAGGLSNMVLYAQQLRQSGVAVRGIVIVYSDGADNASRQTAAAVHRAAVELLRQEIYTLAYVGFGLKPAVGFAGTNGRSPLQRQADEIGFPLALSAGLSVAELRRIFRLVSMSTVQVSRQQATPAPLFA
jgi:hypothetical protein